MTPYQKVNIQTFILATLRSCGATGLSDANLLILLRREGFTAMTLPELEQELRALADNSWVLPFAPPLGDKRWRITVTGTSILTEQGI